MPGEFGVTRSAPSGAIALWGGALSNIPSGWAVCDGNNGTPNLLDRFMQSVPNASTDPGTTGGTEHKSMTVAEMPQHSHGHDASTSTDGQHTHETPASSESSGDVDAEPSLENANSGSSRDTTTSGSHSHSSSVGGTGAQEGFDNRPPYYELAFIMKV